MRNYPPRGDGHAAIPSPFSSQDLGHARTCALHEFKPPGPGLKLRSTTWEFSDIAFMLTTGPHSSTFDSMLEVLDSKIVCVYIYVHTCAHIHVYMCIYIYDVYLSLCASYERRKERNLKIKP